MQRWKIRETLTKGLAVVAASTLIAPFLSGCGNGEGDGDGGVVFEKPHIIPDLSPVCLNYVMPHIEVNKTYLQNIQLRNDGRESLKITSGDIVNDTNGHFEFIGVEPKTVELRDSAIAQFRYKPTETGWDTGILRIVSNAENFPTLDIFILAYSVPVGTSTGSYDPGARPAGTETTCP